MASEEEVYDAIRSRDMKIVLSLATSNIVKNDYQGRFVLKANDLHLPIGDLFKMLEAGYSGVLLLERYISYGMVKVVEELIEKYKVPILHQHLQASLEYMDVYELLLECGSKIVWEEEKEWREEDEEKWGDIWEMDNPVYCYYPRRLDEYEM